jgi:phage-related protein
MPLNCNTPVSLDNLCVAVVSQKRTTYRVVQQQYGDGYLARRTDGINPVNYIWTVATPPMPLDEAQAFEAELEANGPTFFSWTPPNDSTPSNWILDPVAWEWSYPTNSMASISFSLRRWYGN